MVGTHVQSSFDGTVPSFLDLSRCMPGFEIACFLSFSKSVCWGICISKKQRSAHYKFCNIPFTSKFPVQFPVPYPKHKGYAWVPVGVVQHTWWNLKNDCKWARACPLFWFDVCRMDGNHCWAGPLQRRDLAGPLENSWKDPANLRLLREARGNYQEIDFPAVENKRCLACSSSLSWSASTSSSSPPPPS